MAGTRQKGVEALNELSQLEFDALMLACCASEDYVQEMCKGRPFTDENGLVTESHRIWAQLNGSEKMKHIMAHARIGGFDVDGTG